MRTRCIPGVTARINKWPLARAALAIALSALLGQSSAANTTTSGSKLSLIISTTLPRVARPASDTRIQFTFVNGGSVSYIIPDPLLSDPLEVFDASHRHVERTTPWHTLRVTVLPLHRKSPTLVAPGQSYRAGRSGRTAYSLSELGYDLPPGDFSIDAAVFASSTSGEQIFVRSNTLNITIAPR